MITTVQPYSANVICLWLSNSNTRLHSDAPGSEWTRAVDSLKQKLFSTGCIDAHQRIGNFAAHSEADVLSLLKPVANSNPFVILASLGPQYDDRYRSIFGNERCNRADFVSTINAKLGFPLLDRHRTPWYSCRWPSGPRTPARVFEESAARLISRVFRSRFFRPPFRLSGDTNARIKARQARIHHRDEATLHQGRLNPYSF